MRVPVFPRIGQSLEKEQNYNYCTVVFTRGTLEFQFITFSDNLTLSDCLGGFTDDAFLQRYYLMQPACTKRMEKMKWAKSTGAPSLNSGARSEMDSHARARRKKKEQRTRPADLHEIDTWCDTRR